jgi:hypothetical protein
MKPQDFTRWTQDNDEKLKIRNGERSIGWIMGALSVLRELPV